MQRRFGMLIASIALLLLVGAGCAVTQDAEDTASNGGGETSTEPIKIGWVGPLTGDAAVYGDPIKKATELAVEEVNENGGVNGRMLEVVYEDGKCNGKDAAGAVQKLLSTNNVEFVLGGICSGELLAMAPITEAANTLLFSPSATSPDISSAGDFVFRNIPADDGSGSALAELVYNDGFRSVAFVSESTDFAEGILKVFTERFEELGGKILLTERYSSQTRDFRTIITKVKGNTSVDAVVINPQTHATGAPFVKQLRELKSNVPVYTNSVMASADFVELSGEAAEGTTIIDVPGLSDSNEMAQTFLSSFQQKFNEEPGFPFYAGSGYDGVHILAEAIEKVGTGSEAVRDYFYGITAYNGVIGQYGFDSNGDLVGIDYVVRHVVDGEVTLK